MITKEIINPKSVTVIVGSKDLAKPRVKMLNNLVEESFNFEYYLTYITNK